ASPVDESLDYNFWETQPEKNIGFASAGFTHTQTVELADGSHYVIYGNSAGSNYPWHAQIFANGTLVAEGDVVRGSHLRGNFTIGEEEPEPPPGEPYGVIDDFTVPESLPAGSDVTVRVLLRNIGDVAGTLIYGIDGNPDSPDRYRMVEGGATPVLAPGASVWLDVYFRYVKMPSWDFNLTAS
ncbi:unnamed protein product, partial [marine sediment metagenome]